MPETVALSSLPETQMKSKSFLKGKNLLFLISVVFLLALLGGGLFLLRSQKEKKTPPAITPTPEVIATPTPTGELTPTPTSKPTVTPTPTAKPTPTVKPKGISVRVLNGSGIVGTAAKAAEFLKTLGYEILGTGNAENYNFEKTEISAKKSQTLLQLQTDLATKYEIGTTSANLTATESADAVAIIGKK